MDKTEVFKILEENKNERGILNWKRFAYANWTSYGIGLTQLKKIAKQIGRNHELAIELWNEPNYDVKIISILIEEPKKVDLSQIESMVKSIDMWMITHVWVQNLFSKVSFAKELAEKWRNDEASIKRQCGFAFIYYLAKDKKIEDVYFYPILYIIEKEIQQEKNFVKDAMNNALFAIGQRSTKLNRESLKIAKVIGKVVVDYGDNSCEAVDVVKHLSSEKMQQKFN